MNPPPPASHRRYFWRGPLAALALAAALAVAGCGGAHAPSAGAPTATLAGVNLDQPGAAVVAHATPNVVTLSPPHSLRGGARATFRRGEGVAAQAGCLGCHVIGANGNNGPGPALTHIGARLTRVEIRRTLVDPTAPMPSFAGLAKPKLRALTAFLADLR